jgi:DNA-binding GntR family transcriptional regulator
MPLAAPKETRYRTKQQVVYRTLREAILRCDLGPGERLVIDELARQLEVSAIPVREALQLLQSEGLVQSVPHVGATVAPVSAESVHEVFTILEGLELVGTRAAAQRCGPADLAVLNEMVGSMDEALAAGRYDEWAEQNSRFHLTVSRLSGMPLLAEMTERVLQRWERVRRYFFRGVLVHRVDQAQGEHRELLQAMRRRDLEQTERIVRDHNQGALRAYTEYLRRAPANGEDVEAASDGAQRRG